MIARLLLPRSEQAGVRLLLTARGLMSAARAAAAVLVPLYLIGRGFTGLRLGLLFALVAAVSAVLSTAIGISADRVGRRPFVVALPLLAAAAGVAYAVGAPVPVLVVAAALGSFGRGAGAGGGNVGPYQPAEQALVAGLVPPRRRDHTFALLASASAAGGLVGGLVAAAPGGYPVGFGLAAGLAALAGLVAVLVPEPAPARRDARPSAPPGSARGRPRWRPRRQPRWHPRWHPRWGRPRWRPGGHPGWHPRWHPRWTLSAASTALLVRLLATNTVNGIAVGLFGPFISYYLHLRFHASAARIGLLFAAVNAATVLTSLTAGWLSRRLGLVRAVTAVRVAQSLLLVPFALAPTFLTAGAVYTLRTVVQRLGLPLRQSYVMGAADPTERASVAALSQLPSQLMAGAAPVASGALFDAGVLELPFLLAGGLQLVGTVLFYLFFRGRPPEGERAGEVGSGQPAPAAPGPPPGVVATGEVRVGDCGHEFPIRGEP